MQSMQDILDSRRCAGAVLFNKVFDLGENYEIYETFGGRDTCALHDTDLCIMRSIRRRRRRIYENNSGRS